MSTERISAFHRSRRAAARRREFPDAARSRWRRTPWAGHERSHPHREDDAAHLAVRPRAGAVSDDSALHCHDATSAR